MERRHYDTSDYLASQEKEVEVNLPMTSDDMLSLRQDISDISWYFKENRVVPQHTHFSASGYTDTTGTERIDISTSTSGGIATGLEVRLSKQHDTVSFCFDPHSHAEHPAIMATRKSTGSSPARTSLSPADMVFELAHFMPTSEPLLRLRAQTPYPTITDIAHTASRISNHLGLAETFTQTYSYTEPSYAHRGVPYASRSVILRETRTDTSLGETNLALSSQPLSPDTGAPLKNASYGYHFSFPHTPMLSQSTNAHVTYGTAVGFGRSSHPQFGEEYLRDILRPNQDPRAASEYYRATFVDAATVLMQSQLPELEF